MMELKKIINKSETSYMWEGVAVVSLYCSGPSARLEGMGWSEESAETKPDDQCASDI
jgi:hypothetical protein